MSSEKHLPSIPQSPLQADAPPPYSTLVAVATLLESVNPATQYPDGEPGTQPITLGTDNDTIPVGNQASLSSASSLPIQPPKLHKRSLSSSSASSLKTKRSWFSSSLSSSTTASSLKVLNDVRSTVVGLLKDLVKNHSSGSPAAIGIGILNSCAEVCKVHSISLSDILQDKLIEGHSPVYWAIIKRTKPEHEEEEDLVTAMLYRAIPLKAETIQELRHACLATSDQVMFQRLRPHFSLPGSAYAASGVSVPGTDQILLGAPDQDQLQADDVRVTIAPGLEGNGAFEVEFSIREYHTRMMIAKEIVLEFVARNRIWKFAMMITPEGLWHGPPAGSWCVSISLQESSPPTWLDARLVLINRSENSPETESNGPTSVWMRSKIMLEGPKKDKEATKLVVPLDQSPLSGVQYVRGGRSFADNYATLRLRLEAKLKKPDIVG